MQNLFLVFFREIRDQLRDRRTLFTIVVLPMLLYPMMGMVFIQVAQFRREHDSKIWIIGHTFLPEDPPLIVDGQFAPGLLTESEDARVQLTLHDPDTPIQEAARQALKEGRFDAVVVFSKDFSSRLKNAVENDEGEALEPLLMGDSTNEPSRFSMMRAEQALNRWREKLVAANLKEYDLSAAFVQPFAIKGVDVAPPQRRRAFGWAKILPFIAFIWALTGAFYPAIDMCAGEKERGTLETLLVSPAKRIEIVLGKLITVMAFSLGTSLLNLLGFAITGLLVLPQLESNGVALFGAPPWGALGWLVLTLIPVSALFSAVAIALAAFARSSKEGQYYLMPVLFICMPLMTFALMPGVELSVATSLIPLTGLLLWLRGVLEGRLAEVWWYIVPISAVTLGGCWLAIRWAVNQFHSESVLFSEGSRWNARESISRFWRRRKAVPSWNQALLIAICLLAIRLFAGAGGDPEAMKSWRVFSWLQVRSLIVTIGLPAVIAAFVLTRNPLRTLRLDRISPLGVLVAVLLAVAIHPFGLLIASLVQQWLPIQSGIASQLMDVQKMMSEAAIWQVLLVLAVTPAICEELAFRGVLLSGFNSRGRTLGAVVLSSLFFGLTHGVIQQSLTAALLGLVIGAVAVWSRSLWNCIAFHCTYNGLMFLIALRATNWLEKWPTLSWIWKVDSEAGVSYRWFVTLAATTSAAMLLAWFYYQREHSEEDKTDDEKPISRAAIPRPHTEALVTSPNPK